MLADINRDEQVNAFDIDPFVQLLVGGQLELSRSTRRPRGPTLPFAHGAGLRCDEHEVVEAFEHDVLFGPEAQAEGDS